MGSDEARKRAWPVLVVEGTGATGSLTDVALPSQFYISLFAGVGGLDLGLRIALPEARCVGAVEINIEAAEVLAARMEDGSMEPAPIWSDVRTFPCELYRGRVAGIIGGFPCTDLSVAGKRAGIHGEHSGLWFQYLRIIREVEPRWVFIENVPAVIAFPAGGIVLGGLAESGYDAVWLSLRASDVGASHGRLRVFILAYKQGLGLGSRRTKPTGLFGIAPAVERNGKLDDTSSARRSTGESEQSTALWDASRRGEPDGRCDSVADSERSRWAPTGSGRQIDTGSEPATRCSGMGNMGNPDEPGLEGRRECGHGSDERATGPSGDSELVDELVARGITGFIRGEAGYGGSLPIFAPGPGATELWSDLLVRHPELRPAISQAEIERIVHDLDDGLAAVLAGSRTDQLRACGNGVVPLQAAVAFRILSRMTGLTICDLA